MKNKPYPWYHDIEMETIKEYINYCVNKYPDNIAFSYKRNQQIINKTYNEFNQDMIKIALYIYDKIGMKNNIAILGENSYEWILLYTGIVNSRNVLVPIDKELSVEEAERILFLTDSKILFYSENYSDYAEIIMQNNPNIELINIENLKKYITNINNEENKRYNDIKTYPNEEVAILYTSGTTGVSKGVVLTNKSICFDVLSGVRSLKMEDSTILLLPLHHAYSLTGAILGVMFYGCRNHINNSLKNFKEDLIEQKPKFLYVVPLMIETLYLSINKEIKKQNKEKIIKIMIFVSDFLFKLGIDIRRKIFKKVLISLGGNLDMIVSGGAVLEVKYQRWFHSIGISALAGYGITECSPFVSVNRNNHYKFGSVGPIMHGVDVKIEKADEKEKIGEICIKGNILMKEYYKDEKQTKQVFDNEGYFKTGDLGFVDSDNFLYITGRKKNLIICSNGENVSPEELESKILNCKAVSEVIVKEKKNNIIAEIFPNKEFIQENNIADIKDYFKKYIDGINKKLPGYKNIYDIEIRENEFEKTTTKKIKR